MNKSFTLIELLVVIAIIGLLSSIVLVSLSGTRDRANIAKVLLYSSQVYHALGSDIVGNWNLDEGSGTSAKDSSGYSNHGTISGAIYTSDTPHKAAGQGAGKYALSFDGVNDYVDCGNGTSLNFGTGDVTYEAWIKPNSITGYHGILFKGNSGFGVERGFGLATYGDKVRAQITGDSELSFLSNATLTTGAWYHLILTKDSSYVTLYVNGQFDKRLASPAGSIDSAISQRIGLWGSGYYFNGLIDEVRIYSRALTAFEIQQHYAQGSKIHKNLATKLDSLR